MKIKIDEVPASGLRLRFEEPAASLDRRLHRGGGGRAVAGPDGSGVSAVRSPLHASLDLARVQRALAVAGRVEVALVLECARCLAPVEATLSVDMALLFVPERAGAAAERDPLESLDLSDLPFELAAEDLEVLEQAGPEIDLGEAVVDQIVLALPQKPLCQENCLGLCPSCGQDLNAASCPCAADRVDPRFAALKNLKLSR